MTCLAVVPARGGSKGVPRKNLRSVAGRSLLEWAIGAARRARCVDAVVVSTDDDEIAGVAESLDAEVISRPEEFATDSASMVPVAQHALVEAERRHHRSYDVVLLLQPPAPIRTGADIDAAVALLEGRPGAPGVVSVIRVEDAHPGRMYRLGPTGVLEPLMPRWESVNRQDLPRLYHRNGALYVVRRETLMDDGVILGGEMVAYEMSSRWSANVDDERDLVVCDVVMREWLEEMG